MDLTNQLYLLIRHVNLQRASLVHIVNHNSIVTMQH